ncbi:nucleoside diphosphate-linked moiety X motif 8 isoform X2 [Anguilla rostrata]
MLRCSRPLASSGSVWTQRSRLLFAADPRSPVQSNNLSLKPCWERTVRTLCEVSLLALPRPHGEKRSHWRGSSLPRDLKVKSTAAVSWDAPNGYRVRTAFSPFQVPVERAVLSDCLPLPQDPSQVTCTTAGTQTCHILVSHDPGKTTSLEQLSLVNRQKPVRTDLSKRLPEDLLTGESLSSNSVLARSHVTGVRNVCGNLPVQTGLFHEGFSSRWAGSPLKPWTAIPRQSGSLAQSRLLHQGHDASVLSAENEARCRRVLQPNMAVYEREKAKAKEGQRGWAAVLVSLCLVQGEPAFLFTLRSSTLKGRHKGDVSFAGGKQDPSDRDVVDTALREAREELGVAVAASSVWGTLKPLRDMSGMLIAPVLANLGPLEALSFHPNPGEVEEIFTISLAHVCSPKNRGYTNYRVGNRYGYTTPVFLNAKHRVWGLTAVALDHTLKIVVPP